MKPILREEPPSPTLSKLAAKPTASQIAKLDEETKAPALPKKGIAEFAVEASFDYQSAWSGYSVQKSLHTQREREEAEGSSKKFQFEETTDKNPRPFSPLQAEEQETGSPDASPVYKLVGVQLLRLAGVLGSVSTEVAAQRPSNQTPAARRANNLKNPTFIQQAQRQYYLTTTHQASNKSRLAHELISGPTQEKSLREVPLHSVLLAIPQAEEVRSSRFSKQTNRQSVQRLQLRDFLGRKILSTQPTACILGTPKQTRQEFSIRANPYLFRHLPRSPANSPPRQSTSPSSQR